MRAAFFDRNAEFDGVFVAAVRTTGVFCRPSCSARRPRPENVRFFPTVRDALNEGFRPCKRCRPMEHPGSTPSWLVPLLAAVEADPSRRWRDADLRAMGLTPERVRRWFQRHHGLTFHAYSRARRLGAALGSMARGATVTRAAFDSGFDSLSGFQEAFRRYFGEVPTRTTGRRVIHVDRIATPLGPMFVGATEDALCLLDFVDRRALPSQVKRVARRLGAVYAPGRNRLIEEAEAQVAGYFHRTRTTFDLPVTLAGTEFQRSVWGALQAIPYGETRSYRDVAAALGRETAVRAVGRANGLNALALVVPCHRVVGADGRLVGYGGGLWRKQKLLTLERSGEPE